MWHSLLFSVLSKLIPLSSHVWSITSDEFLWHDISSLLLLSSVILSSIIVIHCVLVSVLIVISFKRTFGMNVVTRKVWFSYKIITVWCNRIIFFTTVEIWVNSNTSTLIRLECNPRPFFLLDDVIIITIYFNSVK